MAPKRPPKKPNVIRQRYLRVAEGDLGDPYAAILFDGTWSGVVEVSKRLSCEVKVNASVCHCGEEQLIRGIHVRLRRERPMPDDEWVRVMAGNWAVKSKAGQFEQQTEEAFGRLFTEE